MKTLKKKFILILVSAFISLFCHQVNAAESCASTLPESEIKKALDQLSESVQSGYMLQKRRISKKQADQILNCFCLDIDATRTSFLAGVNRNTANTWFSRFRLAISKFQKAEREKLCGIIELDESYFGGVRKRGCPGKRGRGTNKQPVFGILERSGRVYS